MHMHGEYPTHENRNTSKSIVWNKLLSEHVSRAQKPSLCQEHKSRSCIKSTKAEPVSRAQKPADSVGASEKPWW